MTTPDQIRNGLTLVTDEAAQELQTVAQRAGGNPTQIRAALFAATPLVVGDYTLGAAALALDWYDEIREQANPRRPFTPTPLALVRDEHLAATVAWSTEGLYELEGARSVKPAVVLRAVDAAMLRLLPEVQREVAAGFRDTVTSNAVADPDAQGYQRFARPGACKFCLMLAERGAVYSETTVGFAAHRSCHCVTAPSFDPNAPRASVMQRLAGEKSSRTPAQRAELRDYLNVRYAGAPG